MSPAAVTTSMPTTVSFPPSWDRMSNDDAAVHERDYAWLRQMKLVALDEGGEEWGDCLGKLREGVIRC